MKTIACVALAFGLIFALGARADLRLVAPVEGETICQLRPSQLALVRASAKDRRAFFVDADAADRLKSDGDRPQPIVLSWTGEKGVSRVIVRRLPDGKAFCDQTVLTNRIEIDSLEIARQWEWTVFSGGTHATGTFRTEDCPPRLIRIDGVRNVRDVGGYRGLDGRRVRQGLVFRSGGFNFNALYKDAKTQSYYPSEKWTPGDARMTEDERLRILRDYGFRTDIDLRRDEECFGMKGSPLGTEVRWLHCSYAHYAGAFTDWGRKINREVFSTFMDLDNYPIVFHCILGADRTGTVSMLLLSLLGVSEDDIWLDYCATGFSGKMKNRWADAEHLKLFDEANFELNRLVGSTRAEKAEAYFVSLGFTRNQIHRLREFLLE